MIWGWERRNKCPHDFITKWKHIPHYWLCEGNPPVTGGFPSQRPVTQSFDIFFDLLLNKWLSKQPRSQWFETPSCSLWRWWIHSLPSLAMGLQATLKNMVNMMTSRSSYGNAVLITGPLWGNPPVMSELPIPRASYMRLWYFLLLLASIISWIDSRIASDLMLKWHHCNEIDWK